MTGLSLDIACVAAFVKVLEQRRSWERSSSERLVRRRACKTSEGMAERRQGGFTSSCMICSIVCLVLEEWRNASIVGIQRVLKSWRRVIAIGKPTVSVESRDA